MYFTSGKEISKKPSSNCLIITITISLASQNLQCVYSVKVWQVVDCRSWQPVNYVSMTDRPDQTDGMTLAEREGAQNRLEGWKQVRVGARTVWRDGNR
jgi:hypothetical protein